MMLQTYYFILWLQPYYGSSTLGQWLQLKKKKRIYVDIGPYACYCNQCKVMIMKDWVNMSG